MLRRTLALGISLVAVLAIVLPGTGLPAGAASGSATDPSGDPDDAPIDIVRVTHADTSSTITYTLQGAADFDDATLHDENTLVEWRLNPYGDSTIYVDAGDVTGVFCTDADRDFEQIGDATVTRAASGSNGSTAANTVQVSFARSLLADCGLTGSSYPYYVHTESFALPGAGDNAPDAAEDDPPTLITHNLDPIQSTTTTTAGATTTTAGGGTTTTTAAGGSTTTTTVGATTTTTLPATESEAEVSDDTVRPGQQIVFEGDGFAPNEVLGVTFFSDPVNLGTVRSDEDGVVEALIVIPASATLGAHRIVVTGPGENGETHRAIANVTVVAAGGTLPRTGSSSHLGGWLLAAAVSLLVGAHLVWWRRSAADAFWL